MLVIKSLHLHLISRKLAKNSSYLRFLQTKAQINGIRLRREGFTMDHSAVGALMYKSDARDFRSHKAAEFSALTVILFD